MFTLNSFGHAESAKPVSDRGRDRRKPCAFYSLSFADPCKLPLPLLAHPAAALQSANGNFALFLSLWMLFLLFLLQTLLRRDWLAASVLTLALSILQFRVRRRGW
jgi:hypothetical protein